MAKILGAVLVLIALLVVFACCGAWPRPEGRAKDKMSVVRMQDSESSSLQAMP